MLNYSYTVIQNKYWSVSMYRHRQLEGWGQGDNKLLFSILVPPSLHYLSPVTQQFPVKLLTTDYQNCSLSMHRHFEGWGQGDNKLRLVSSSHHPSNTWYINNKSPIKVKKFPTTSTLSSQFNLFQKVMTGQNLPFLHFPFLRIHKDKPSM